MAKTDWLYTGEIYGVVSAPGSHPRGSGKSLVAIQLAIAQANLLNYGLIFNFDINAMALYRYCLYEGYYNVIRKIRDGFVKVRSVIVSDGKKGFKTDLTAFVKEGGYVYILDEAGVFADSHKWQQISDKFKADLALLRKFGIRLWWISQYYEQVVTKLREQTNYIVECCSILKASRELNGAAKIYRKQYNVYTNLDYQRLYSKRQQWSFLKRFFENWKSAFVRSGAILGQADLLTFKVYESFGQIGDNPQIYNIPEISRSCFRVDYNCQIDNQPLEGGFYEYEIRRMSRVFCSGFDLDFEMERIEKEWNREMKEIGWELSRVYEDVIGKHVWLSWFSYEFGDFDDE